MSTISRVFGSLLIVSLALCGSTWAATPEEVRETIKRAKFGKNAVPEQVRVLIALAWPEEGTSDRQVQAEARQSLVKYGHYALPGIRRAIPNLDPLLQADAASAFIEARFRNPAGMPPDYLPGLEETIWYGSSEAQRIAMNEIRRYVYPPAVLSSIDAAYTNPILTRYVVATLASMQDPRARLFLTDLLLEGSDFYKGAAARGLMAFGDSSFANFRSGIDSDDATTRQTALRIFLPLTETSDLEALRAYLALRTEDDPALREAVRQRIEVLERRTAP